MKGEYTFRPLEGTDEYRACVDLQEETWGRGFSERVAPAILQVSQLLGGVATGAWSADGTLVGFVFGMTGPRDGVLVHWSDMLAVRPEARNTGLGRELKLRQRDEVLARGIRIMHWTFDPLRTRNAHLNFARLGIVAREYVEDMYGQTDSPLHRGIGTDRLVALWELDGPRMEARLANRPPPPTAEEVAGVPAALDRGPDPGSHPVPTAPDLSLTSPEIRVVVPPDIGALMESAPEGARAWRTATRAVFRHYLLGGWEVREFVRDEVAPAYLLVRRDDPPPPSHP